MTEKSTCGSSNTNPCSDLLDTINKAKGGDTIMVDGNVSHGQPINVCCETFISKSITIIGYNGQPRLACNKTDRGATLFMFTSVAYSYMYQYYSIIPQVNNKQYQNSTSKKKYYTYSYGLNASILLDDHLLDCVKYMITLDQCYQFWINHTNINVHVENISFLRGLIYASDINVTFVSCEFIDASIHFSVPQDPHHQVNQNKSNIPTHCKEMEIHFVRTKFLSEFPTENPFLTHITSKCDHVSMTISDSLIIGKTFLFIPGFKGGHVIFSRVMFRGTPTLGRYIGIYVDNHECEVQHGHRFQLEIVDSLFRDMYTADKMLTVLFEYLKLSYGAIYIRINGDIYLNVKNTTFIGNERAVGIDMAKGQIHIEDCIFTKHSSMFGGGVIQVINNDTNLTIHINNSTFDNNKAGCVNDIPFEECMRYSEKMTFVGKQYIRSCNQSRVADKHYIFQYDVEQRIFVVVEENGLSDMIAKQTVMLEANGAVILAKHELSDILVTKRKIGIFLNKCTFKNNGVQHGHGGALYFEMYQIDIVECVFMANMVNGSGGAIYSSHSYLNIRSCLLSENHAINGSALYSVGVHETIQISYSVIRYNQAGSCGGGLWLQGGRLIMDRCTFTANKAYGNGGGIYTETASIQMSYCIIHNNQAGRHGGGLCFVGDHGGIKWHNDTYFHMSAIVHEGGGIWMGSKAGDIVMIGCQVMSNRAIQGAGGGVYGKGTMLTMKECDVTFNKALKYNGGGLCLEEVIMDMSHSNINNNHAGHGGCGHRIQFCDVIHEVAMRDGAGLYLTNVATNITHCSIRDNYAEAFGGGMKVLQGMFVMTRCDVTNNIAGHNGGGLLIIQVNNAHISYSNISKNIAIEDGGGVWVDKEKTFVMIGCHIMSNTANNGGGLYLNNVILIITLCSIEYNEGNYFNAGGISMLYGKFVMRRCNVTSNIAAYTGGGLYLSFVYFAHISHSRILNNRATSGGGLYITMDMGSLYENREWMKYVVTRCDIISNTAYEGGGLVVTALQETHWSYSQIELIMSWCKVISNKNIGLHLHGFVIHMSHMLIHSNTAYESAAAVLANLCRLVIDNVIFTENKALVKDDALYIKNSSVYIHNSTFQLVVDAGTHLYLRSSNITVENCIFAGGNIQVKLGSILTLNNIIYANNNVTNILQGVIFSEGKTIYNGVSLFVNNNTNNEINIVVLKQIAPGNSVIRDLYIYCPYRQNIQVTNTSQDNIFDVLEIVCTQQCDIGYNTFTHANIHLRERDNETILDIHQETICQKCPYGGECSQTMVSSKPGFWGSIFDTKVEFYPCIAQCSSCGTNCSDEIFTICAPHRQGPICTECAANYTEAMFSSSCVPDRKCTDTWFVPIIITVGIAYSMFLLFQESFIDLILKLPIRNSAVGDQISRSLKSDNKYFDSIFIINIFYYFQDSALLYVKTPFSQSDKPTVSSIKEIIAGLFEFRLDVLHLGKDICIFPGLNTVQKTVLKTLFMPLMWFTIIIIYEVASCLKHNIGSKMSRRATNAFLLSIMFSFQKLAIAYFSLMHCTTILDLNVLTMQATTECYTYWQILLSVYIGVSIIPFGFYLMICTQYMKHSEISLRIFFLGCIFPLPVILYFIIMSCNQHNSSRSGKMTTNVKVIVDIIQGPYRTMMLSGIEVCWSGVIVLKLNLLIVLYTFVEFPLLRSILIFFLCCGYMVIHSIMLPYKDLKGNLAESLSQGALTIISGINLVRAMLVSQQSVPLDPTQSIMDIIDYVDQLLLLWLPMAGISVLFLFILVRLFMKMKSFLDSKIWSQDSDASHNIEITEKNNGGYEKGDDIHGDGKNSDTRNSRCKISNISHSSGKKNNDIIHGDEENRDVSDGGKKNKVDGHSYGSNKHQS